MAIEVGDEFWQKIILFGNFFGSLGFCYNAFGCLVGHDCDVLKELSRTFVVGS